MDFDVSSNLAEEAVPISSVDNAVQVLYRRSLRDSISCSGIGLHSGKAVNMRLVPSEPGSGVVFKRLGVAGDSAYIRASYENVFSTERCTSLRNSSGVVVSTVEHICSALYGLGISDVLIELDAEEVPIMDGSCQDFVAMMNDVGLVEFSDKREVLRVLRDIEVSHADGRSCRLEVADDSIFSYNLDYSNLVCGSYDFSLTVGSFDSDIALARTFGDVSDLDYLRENGFALGADYSNVIALDSGRVMNEGGLRCDDEMVRHKILDAMGDLYLSGYPILGRFVGDRSGHGLNNLLLRKLFSDKKNYTIELV